MGLTEFSITVNQNKLIYLPGETVYGQVNVRLNGSMKMSEINVKFGGKAFVHWSEGSDKNRRHYSGREILFKSKTILFGKGASATGNDDELSSGDHTFPITFQLPPSLPSSYEDNIGYIRYSIKAEIVKPWKLNNRTKMVFTVLDVLDLNGVSDALSQSHGSASKQLCCWCCASGPISCELHLDRKGYVPGEWIIINATAENGSNSNVKRTSAEIVQKVTYHATAKSKCVEKVVVQIFGQECRPHGTISWTNEKLQIPAVPPSEMTHCKIIDIHYFVRFHCHLRTCSIDLKAYAPIVIGTIPLNSLPQYSQMNFATQAPPFPADASHQAPTAPQQSMPPPPSYAQSFSGPVNVAYNTGGENATSNLTYAPQYNYYDWKQEAFTYN